MHRPEVIQNHNRASLLRWAALLGCAAFLCQLVAYNFVDIDLWHQMALIRESLSAGHLLKADPYAYTPTLPWIDHEWGAGAIAYFSTAWLGGRAIILLKFLAALGTLLVCLICARMRGATFHVTSMCALLSIFLMHLGFLSTVRAQAYSFFLTALWLLFLEMDRCHRRRWMFAALIIFPLWLNLHAGFVVALFFTALHAIENGLRGRPFRHLLLLLLGMILEVLLNPYGAEYFTYLQRGLLMARPYSAEWDAVYTLGTGGTAAFVAALLLAAYSVWATGWHRATGVFILTGAAIEAAMHRKLLPLFAIACLCYVPAYLQVTAIGQWWMNFATRRRAFMSAAWILFACLAANSAISQKPWNLNVPQPIYPVGPVEYLAAQKFAGNLMVPFRLGAYVSWKLYPAVKVSLDSRYEVAYPDIVVKQAFDFYEARANWRSTLAAYPTDAVLVPLDEPISKLMPSTNWQRIYTDRQFQLYARPGLSLPTQDCSATAFHGSFP